MVPPATGVLSLTPLQRSQGLLPTCALSLVNPTALLTPLHCLTLPCTPLSDIAASMQRWIWTMLQPGGHTSASRCGLRYLQRPLHVSCAVQRIRHHVPFPPESRRWHSLLIQAVQAFSANVQPQTWQSSNTRPPRGCQRCRAFRPTSAHKPALLQGAMREGHRDRGQGGLLG